ncbi:MAG: CYTH domain-containing protein [Treponema sp.]|nr:CYTH domain-containing protein [Treponema sp.]
MFEIEIKAWVRKRQEVIEKLNSFSEYICSIDKDDTYYKFPVENAGKYVSFRIRKEKVIKNGIETSENLFTYKKKENRITDDGSSIEVNSENEFSFSDPLPLELLASDLGGKVYLKKRKITECWHFETECGQANIELCTVPPLGDFLEIEIVTDREDSEWVSKIRKIEESIFLKCGIPLSDEEPRYYSELLKAAGVS